MHKIKKFGAPELFDNGIKCEVCGEGLYFAISYNYRGLDTKSGFWVCSYCKYHIDEKRKLWVEQSLRRASWWQRLKWLFGRYEIDNMKGWQ